MDRYEMEKSPPLSGEVRIGASKNALLPMMAASLLTSQTCRIMGVPPLGDVMTMASILRCLGARIAYDAQKEELLITARHLNGREAPYEESRRVRTSVLCMGPILARYGSARFPLPGGCAIGNRPVDLHMKAFESLGARIRMGYGAVEAEGRLTGGNVLLDLPSVGATENAIMAAVLAEGSTRIFNPAKEPEIVDLVGFLRAMGANIAGEGTDTISIEGVKTLNGCEYRPIPDRIEAGTLMMAAIATGGNVLLRNARPEHMRAVISKLREAGARINEYPSGVRVRGGKLSAIDIKTHGYPGFPTDLQPMMMTLYAVANGTSIVHEAIFENRFMHVPELRSMGAHIHIDDRTAVIEGPAMLSGARVRASDLRAGAALVIAGLAARGTTVIEEIRHIDRGYYRLEEKLSSLGAIIRRLDDRKRNAHDIREPRRTGGVLRI